jgi:alanine racemase
LDAGDLSLSPATRLGAGTLRATTDAESPRRWALGQGFRVWAEIDLDRLSANVRELTALAGRAKLLAVVKGNAYGHGAIAVARAALQAGAWGIGVVGLEEAEHLRRGGVEGPVLVVGHTPAEMAQRAVEMDARLVVGDLEVGEALSRAGRAAGRQARVHVKVETGLNRFGVLPDEAVVLAERLRELPNVIVEGLCSHLASVDEGDKEFTLRQYLAFRDAANLLPWIPLHHLSSTGAIIDVPEISMTMVRTGIGVYGYHPSDELNRRASLSPILSLRSRVARVQGIAAGESVGYGRSWRAERPSRIATVMAGYADGIRRSLSNRGLALVRGCRAPFVGRVAMDMIMLDVTDIPDAAAGDEVTLIGEQGGVAIDADEVAVLCDTISYEVLAGIMARVPRLYLRDGRIVAREDLAGYRELSAP